MSRNHRRVFLCLVCIVNLVLLAPPAGVCLLRGEEKSSEEERAEVRKMRDPRLADLHKEKPELKVCIKKAAENRVFGNVGVFGQPLP
jgi:hypothetical protein